MSEITLDDAFAEPEKVAEETNEVEESAEETPEETSEEITEKTTEENSEESSEGSTTEPEKSWTFSQAMDEREKRQAAVKRADEAEAKLAKLTGESDVSIFDDEAKFLANQDKKLNEQLTNTTLNMSQAFAEEIYGDDKVAKAVAWFKTEGAKSPYVMNRFNTAKLPYHEVVKMFDDEQTRLDPEAYKAKLKAEILAELKDDKEEEHETITPSLASKRSSGTKQTPEDYEDMLGE